MLNYIINRLVFLIFILEIYLSNVCLAIDCFKCVSLNGDNVACEDPFNNNYTSDLLNTPCMAGRKSRNGLFPATACVKINGIYEDTGQSLMVRGCALDSGTLTVDTELVRMSHCGGFYFDERYVRGCVMSCTTDACNSISSIHHKSNYKYVSWLLTFILLLHSGRSVS